MKKIVLLCAGGMSTSVLVNNMKQEAANEGFDCFIDAYPIDSAEKVGADAHAVLLGPQVSYREKEVAEVVTCPVGSIDMMAYGMMDGRKALDQAKGMMGV